MKWLNRFTLIQIMSALGAIMLLLVLFLAALNIRQAVLAKSLADQDLRLISLVDALEKVAHQHAIERGLTAGYLGSPTPEALNKVRQQREVADSAEQHFLALYKEAWPGAFLTEQNTALVREQLRNKAAVRREVDAKNGANAFSYYSKLNQYALDAARALTLNTNSKLAGSEISLALSLAMLKERAGQLRGKVNGILASRQITPQLFSQSERYLRQMEDQLQSLATLTTGEQRAKIEGLSRSAAFIQMQQVMASLGNNPDFNRLPAPKEWFASASKFIADAKEILDIRWAKVAEDAIGERKASTIAIWLTVFVTVIALGLVVALYLAALSLMRYQLSKLTYGITQIGVKGDLTTRILLSSDNELGQISQALNKTVKGLKQLMLGLKVSVSTSTSLSTRLDETSVAIVNDARVTEEKSLAIASAIEQMAAASAQISQEAVKTLDAASIMDSMADKALAANSEIQLAMQALSRSMAELEQYAGQMERQVTDISSFLEEINSLSDQTNLLALNAAIEAARAGEHGRGFSVVADEVRKLATASRASSDRISTLLAELQQASIRVVQGISTNSKSAVESGNVTKEGQQIAGRVKEYATNVAAMSTTMAAAAEQQSAVATEIARDIISVQDAATKELQVANELRTVAEDLSKNNQLLTNTMSNFKVE